MVLAAMLSKVVVLATVASVSAVPGCYGAGACTAPHGCADCSMAEAECTAAGKSWVAEASSMCAAGTAPAQSQSAAVYGGCYKGTACGDPAPHGCADCSMTEAECTTAEKTWMADATAYCAE